MLPAIVVLALVALPMPRAIAASLEDTIARIKPSIMAVGTYQATRSPPFEFRGTGFVVGDGTLVATNAHVVPQTLDTAHLESIAIVIPAIGGGDSQRREARVAAIDKEHDIALLRISGPPLPVLAFVAPGGAREGEMAAFTGFPIGSVLGLVPVTHRAMVAAITPIALPSANANGLKERVVRRIQTGAFKVLQLDATAYPGNSGSPLYDTTTGDVIGIINMVLVKATKEAALSQPSGISFAIPAEYLRELVGRAKD
jgi:serine protease Do